MAYQNVGTPRFYIRVHPAPDFELDSEEIVESDDVLD